MAMIQSFFLGILLFVQSILAPVVFNVPKGAVDYGGGFAYEEATVENPLYIFREGQTAYFLVTPDTPSPTIETGAAWIQDFTRRITGKTFTRKTASEVLPGDKYIALGVPALGGFGSQAGTLSDEDFVKRVDGDNIHIFGNGAGRGTMYGCASFIEDELGCRWFTPTLKVVRERQDVCIEAGLNDTQEAVFDYRDDYWPFVYLYPEFKAFHKINSFMGSHMGVEYGRSMEYFSAGFSGSVFAANVPEHLRHEHYGGFCHTMYNLVPRALFYGDYYNPVIGQQKQDKELFAYRKDKKDWVEGQRCLTNSKVLELTKLGVFACIDAHIDDPNFKIMSVTQEDNDDYCQCPKCEAMDALYGGPSGTNIWFTNEIAKAVAAKYTGRKDILIDTFAYTYTVEPPTGIVPEKNVIVRMCSMGCCFNHPLRDCGYGKGGLFPDMKPHDSEFARQMRGWSDLCAMKEAQLYVWDYTTTFKFYPAIHPNLHVLADNLQFFAENRVRGVYEQGYDTGGTEVLPGSASGEFGELRGYLLAKLLWNPDLNSNQIMKEFMEAYYGKASAPLILEFLDFCTNIAIGTNHISVFGRPEEFVYLNAFQCKKMDKLFDRAEALAGSEEQLLNIKRTRLCLRLHKANMMLCEFSWFNPFRLRENKKLFHDSVMLGMDRYSAVMSEPYNTYVWLHRPYDWAKMTSWIDFVDKSKVVPLDLEAYRAAHR